MNTKRRNVLLSLFVFIFFATSMVTISLAATNSREGEGVTPPTFAKTLTPNGDGTYTLSLSVTGRSESFSASNKANVVVIFDTSWSMNSQTPNGKRDAVARRAVKNLSAQLFANNTAENPDLIEMALLEFNNKTTKKTFNGSDWTSSETAYSGVVDTLYAHTDGNGSGTNWEDALQAVKQLLDAKKTDEPDQENYVLFVSDGNPTFRNTRGNYSIVDINQFYYSTMYTERDRKAILLPFRVVITMQKTMLKQLEMQVIIFME